MLNAPGTAARSAVTVIPHRRGPVITWVVLAALAVPAWLLSANQAHGMEGGPGTMGLALPLFLVLWLVMMVAMMLPSVAPVVIAWAHAIGRRSAGAVRVARMAQFLGGYVLVWVAFGLLAYAGLAATGRLIDSNPDAGRWIGAAAFLLAALHQLGPLKQVCLRHCRNPMAHLLHYSRFRRPARDLRVGVHHGAYCVGCCCGLMIILIPLGVMNIAAMAGLAAVIFLEKLWWRGTWLAWAVGLVFLVFAALSPFQDWLLPGLQATEQHMDRMTG